MTKPFTVSLKAGERVFVNGAVIRAGSKVSLEFLNDVTFLLEQHVMRPESTTTPLRQLYFIVQTMLMDPAAADSTRMVFDASYELLAEAVETPELKEGLAAVSRYVGAGRIFEALRTLRNLYAVEALVLQDT